MTDQTKFEESTQVIIDLPMAHLDSEIRGIRQVAAAYLRELTTLARNHILWQIQKAGLLETYQPRVDNLGEVDLGGEAGRVRRIVVRAVKK